MSQGIGHVARHRVLGVVFLCLLLGAVWMTHAVFTNRFTDYDEVTLRTSKLGLQLPDRADVKVRGVIVGEVLDFEPDAEGATVTLGLHPEQRGSVPADVTGSILPKTLFGEKYVSLVPSQRSGADAVGPIEPGATIERTEVATEVEQVLSDLYPLLRAVQPAELNMTLNALATALEGRGEQLGQQLETVDAYLAKLNPQIPALVEDLRLTAEVSDTYADVMPEVAAILRDTIRTTGTLQGREQKLHALFSDVAGLAGTTERFLSANGDNLIRLGELSVPQARLLAKYSPQYPCLLDGIVRAGKLQAEAFRGFTLHIVLETLPHQPRGYNAQDVPRFGAKNGPHCGGLPTPGGSQADPYDDQPNFDDGVDEPTGKGTMRVGPGFAGNDGGFAGNGGGFAGSSHGFVGGPEEARLLKGLLGPALGSSPGAVPDLGVLLVGPMARGAEVSLR